MPKPKPKVKHITKTCPLAGCSSQAFVQVLLVADKDTQKKIDALARQKLVSALSKAHEDGEHD